MASLEEARQCLVDARDTIHQITGPEVGFCPGGSVWVWDGADPADGGSWHHYETIAVDLNAALYLDPSKVDGVRHEAEVLLNAFPATERRLEHLGYGSSHLVHETIKTPDQVLFWACSVFNACTPLPAGWRAGFSDPSVPGARDWPAHVFSTAQLVPDGFQAVHLTEKGRIAVLPVEERCAVIYWAEPGSWYDREVARLAPTGDMVLPPDHPVTRAAYHG